MQQETQQITSHRPKVNVKRMALYARVVLFVLILSGVIITSVLVAMTGATSTVTALSGALTALLAIVTVIQLYPILFPARPATTQATSIPVPANPNNVQSGSIVLSTGTKTGQPIFFFNLPLRDPNEFYGHNAARTTLIDRISKSGSSSLVGERRAGKTWLLEYLQLIAPTHSKLGPTYHIGCVSATHPRGKSLANFVQWALEELEAPLSHNPGSQPLDQLSQGVCALEKLGIIPVLCIDEFEGFDNKQEFNIDFFAGLRAMTQSDGLVLVTASRHPLKELIEDLTGETSPLFNVVQQIPLSPFTEQEAREFVHDKSSMAGFTEKDSEFFFNQSMLYNPNRGVPSWPPLRLQLVGQMLLDDKQAAQGESLDDKLTTLRYRGDFETRLNETYEAVVRVRHAR